MKITQTLVLISGLILSSVTFYSCDEEVSESVEDKIQTGWSNFGNDNYSASLNAFREAYQLMLEEGRRVPEAEFGLGWGYFRFGDPDSAVRYFEMCMEDVPDAIIPYAFIKLDDLEAKSSRTNLQSTTVTEKMFTFVTVTKPGYTFAYDSSVNYQDGVLTVAQIQVYLTNYAEAVRFIRILDPEFNPDPENPDEYTRLILEKLQTLIALNS